MSWELGAIIAAILAFFFASKQKKRTVVLREGESLDELLKKRGEAIEEERTRLQELEDLINRRIEDRTDVEEDVDGAIDRLRDEFGSS